MSKTSLKDKVIDMITNSLAKSIIKDMDIPNTDNKDEDIFLEEASAPSVVDESDSTEEIDLDKRVQNFLDDYRKTVHELMRSGEYAANLETVLMEAFVNKMAAWYEMVYPDDLLYWTFPTKYEDPHDFICLLTDVEREVLHKHRYRDDLQDGECIYLNNDSIDYLMHARLFVSASGIITETENIYKFSGKRVNESEIIGLKLDEAVEAFKKAGVRIENTKLAKIVNDHNKRLELREKMLDAIMYKLIEHGTYNNTGCMRAYIFAKDFERDINIPIIYSKVTSSKAYREFINTYLHDGGDIDIEHYNDYFLDKYGISKTEEEKFRKTSLRHSMYLVNKEKYNTKEETSLYQRLADSLVTGLVTSEAIDEMRTEAIKEMRIDRKIAKSKRR